MKTPGWMVLALAVMLVFPHNLLARGKKKKLEQRAMIENMEAVPCGAKQHGLTGLGSLWASAGIEHVNSDEKLCPQYLLRTDDMEYRIRPQNLKHAVLLPVGQEAEFKVKKNELQVRTPHGDRKMRPYQVVAVNPVNTEQTHWQSRHTQEKPATYLPPDDNTERPDARLAGAETHPPR